MPGAERAIVVPVAGADDRATRRLLTLPFEPGGSPFRIKGVAYRGHVEYCDRFVPGGHRAALEALGRPAVREFFDQPFLASSYYDVFPLAMAGIGCSRALGVSFLDFVAQRSRWQAAEDVKGVYRLVLKVAAPQMLASRLPRFIAQYFDFGGVELVDVQPGRVSAMRTGIPAPLAEWYIAVSEPYVEVILEKAGAKNVVTTKNLPIDLEEHAHGVDLLRIPMLIEWET